MSALGTPRKAIAALLWTLVVAGALWSADRLLLGRRVPTGWVSAPSLAAVPSHAGRVIVPLFVPEYLGWPPEEILFRERPSAGWWVGLREGTGPVRLWMGMGAMPPPAPVATFEACLTGERPGCPDAWRALSLERDEGVLYVLTDLDAKTAAWLVEGLERTPVGGR